jgi:DNA-binding SARP family transcriptional activator
MMRLRVFGTLALDGSSPSNSVAVLTQPKLTGLLVYLTIARPRGYQQRDRLTGLLWPSLDQNRARAALRNALDRLRDGLGAGAVLSQGNELVAVSTETIEADAAAFDEAVARGALTRALELYQGELLPGFGVPDCASYEEWLDFERQHYRMRAATTALELAKVLEAERQLTSAAQTARLIARLAPTDERLLRHALNLLYRVGDRAGAIDVYVRFVERLWKEYETRPSIETERLIASIRDGT